MLEDLPDGDEPDDDFKEPENGRDAPVQDIRAYETALNLYRMDNFRYPTTEQGLRALVTRPDDPNVRNWKEGGYIDGMKKDPWGNDYIYISPGTHGEYDLYTLGADGQPGGEGPDGDIGNWTIE